MCIMVIIDFHKHALEQAARQRSGFISKANVSLAISIRRTTLSFEFKRPARDYNDASKAETGFSLSRIQ